MSDALASERPPREASAGGISKAVAPMTGSVASIALPSPVVMIVVPLGFIAGLILGIKGRAEVESSDRRADRRDHRDSVNAYLLVLTASGFGFGVGSVLLVFGMVLGG